MGAECADLLPVPSLVLSLDSCLITSKLSSVSCPEREFPKQLRNDHKLDLLFDNLLVVLAVLRTQTSLSEVHELHCSGEGHKGGEEERL